MEQKKTIRKKVIKASVIISIIMIISLIFCNFTGMGYMLTIEKHGFTRINDNIYLDKNYSGNIDGIIDILNKSSDRVENFFGQLESNPKIIISNDPKKLRKLGYIGSCAMTTTYVFFDVYNYVIISPNALDIDVVAHELAHAELHERLFKGNILETTLVPVWFDEGVAMQTDYREKYNEDAWIKATDNGNNVKDLNEIKSYNAFYDSNKDVRVLNFIISKHEVKTWIDNNGIDKLISAIKEINSGKSFNDVIINPK